jgi:hypothetical protein
MSPEPPASLGGYYPSPRITKVLEDVLSADQLSLTWRLRSSDIIGRNSYFVYARQLQTLGVSQS